MKRTVLIFVLIMVFFSVISCEDASTVNQTNQTLKVYSYENGHLKYTYDETNKLSYDHLIHIIGKNTESNRMKESLSLEGIPELKGEKLRIEIFGLIEDFKVVSIMFEENSQGEMVEKTVKVYETIDKVENQVILIDTYFAEGIPSGKVSWKNSKGEILNYYFSQEGFGLAGEIIISE